MALKLYNTLGRKTEEFKPLKGKKAGLYACGPTVYDYAHIGNLRSYIIWDVLRRVLRADGYKVRHVMNITDVGHLTSDADEGEDKMEKGAEREQKTAWEIAAFYTKAFMDDLADLNIEEPDIICRATDHIDEQVNLIKNLEKKGFTYATSDGIYFDTTKLPDYGILANLSAQELRPGARIDMGGKKHPTDFALWKFSPKLQKRQMEWKSPWGIGFPGWHIECSAMSKKYLGVPFDIHCGGIDHVPVHHTNEIAQTEAAEGVIPARFWVHNEFILMNGEKMSKSLGNFATLSDIKAKKINPLAYRYFILQTHYRKQLNFTWEALEAAQNGLKHLYGAAIELPEKADDKEIKEKIIEIINNDLDAPGALAALWTAIKERKIGKKTLFKLDNIFGLKIKEYLKKPAKKTPEEAIKLVKARDEARVAKDWIKSDELRDELVKLGYTVMDTKEGTKVEK